MSLSAALAGTGYAVYAAADEPVAQAMRPPTPERFRRTPHRTPARRAAPVATVAHHLRQIERRPVKALFTVIGLALGLRHHADGEFQEV